MKIAQPRAGKIATSLAAVAIIAVNCGTPGPSDRSTSASRTPSITCSEPSTAGVDPSPAVATATPMGPAPNGKLAFVNVNGGQQSIYAANAIGGCARRITHGPNDGDPAWSPDGRWIAFTGQTDPLSFVQVYVVGADGNGLTRLTAGGANTNPTWSPDGQRLAYAGGGDLPSKIFTMNRDGSSPTRLTAVFNEKTWDTSPAWSPDGSLIAFTRDRAFAGARLFVIKPDGTGEREIDTAVVPTHPSWSRDSKTIAYSGLTGAYRQIWLIKADGTGERQVTTLPSNQTAPAWTGDGNHLLFSSDSSHNPQIYVADLSGGGQTLVSFVSGQNWFPAWCCIR